MFFVSLIATKWSLAAPPPPPGFYAEGLRPGGSRIHFYTGTRRPARSLPLQLIIYVHKILIRNGNGVTYRIGYRKMKMKDRKV